MADHHVLQIDSAVVLGLNAYDTVAHAAVEHPGRGPVAGQDADLVPLEVDTDQEQFGVSTLWASTPTTPLRTARWRRVTCASRTLITGSSGRPTSAESGVTPRSVTPFVAMTWLPSQTPCRSSSAPPQALGAGQRPLQSTRNTAIDMDGRWGGRRRGGRRGSQGSEGGGDQEGRRSAASLSPSFRVAPFADGVFFARQGTAGLAPRPLDERADRPAAIPPVDCAGMSLPRPQPESASRGRRQRGGMPRQIPYIIGNEACERFSFYGMRNILTPFLVSSLLLYLPEADRARRRQGRLPHLRHRRVLLPAARRLARRPLLRQVQHDPLVSAASTAPGHACLAMFEDNRNGFYTGLFLIALGSGGIKPLVVVVHGRPVRPDATSTWPRSSSTRSTGSSTSARSSRRC